MPPLAIACAFTWMCALLALILVGYLAAHDLAVERQGLQHDVEPLAVSVREGEADVEPVVVLAFPFDNRIDTVRRCGWLLVRHAECSVWKFPVSCASRLQGRTAWCPLTRDQFQTQFRQRQASVQRTRATAFVKNAAVWDKATKRTRGRMLH